MSEGMITELLNAWGKGDKEALDRLMELVYPELKAQARKAMEGERASHTLQPTALVNEVYLKLVGLGETSWVNRRAFYALSAKLMRRALVDHAREVGAQKRGGNVERLSLENVELLIDAPSIDLIDLGRALEDLEAADPRLVEIIELKFFSEFTDEEVAEALGLSRATVQREWAAGKRVLARLLSEGKGREP